MTALAGQVLAGLRMRRLVGAGDRLVAAVSGGPDSVALALVLAEVLPELGAELTAVAHLHHMLRGSEADADEAFCQSLAARMGLACYAERTDVAALARRRRLSPEAAGHDARAEFFERARQWAGATHVATGHTRNDLAETFLMRALRGAGLRGLGGIRARQGRVIRPLLDVSRGEVLAFLEARGQPFCEDASNRDVRIARNRVRHEVLPRIEREVAPGAVDALARAARLAADDDACLEEFATRMAVPFVLGDGEGLGFHSNNLEALPVALQRRAVLRVLERVGGRPVTAWAVDRILALTRQGAPTRMAAPGVMVSVGRGRVLFRSTPAAARGFQDPGGGVVLGELPVPGMLPLPGGGGIWAEARTRQPGDEGAREPDRVILDASRFRSPLTVRGRRHGDRLRPLGMSGHKKLQDVLVDRKVARADRDAVPLVVDSNDHIVWVAGHVVANDVRVTPATTSVLLLHYRRWC